MKQSKEQRDLHVAEMAEKEAEAQLVVVRALKPLDHDTRERVIRAVLGCFRHSLKAYLRRFQGGSNAQSRSE